MSINYIIDSLAARIFMILNWYTAFKRKDKRHQSKADVGSLLTDVGCRGLRFKHRVQLYKHNRGFRTVP
jgi:hypothetical protein